MSDCVQLCVLFLTLLLACILSISKASVVVEDYREQASRFYVNHFYYVGNESELTAENKLELIQTCLNNDIQTATEILQLLHNSHNYSLTAAASTTEYDDLNRYVLSHELNACASGGQPTVAQEFLFHCAIAVYPHNTIAVKNLAFIYEWSGRLGAARQLYTDCVTVTGDKGCMIHAAMVAPTILWDNAQSRIIHIRVLRSLFTILRRQHANALSGAGSPTVTVESIIHNCPNSEHCEYINSPLVSLREMPINVQYLGHQPNMITELFSSALVALFPEISVVNVKPRKSIEGHGSNERRRKVIRLGIMAEHMGNSSPGLCLQKILQRLVAASNNNDDGDTSGPIFSLVFFDRPGLHTAFAASMRDIAVQTVVLNTHDLSASRDLIADAAVDVLLYLALPTEKFSYLLAHSRLAPVQIQFGLGHPLSSGISAQVMDYSVVSRDMLEPQQPQHTAGGAVAAGGGAGGGGAGGGGGGATGGGDAVAAGGGAAGGGGGAGAGFGEELDGARMETMDATSCAFYAYMCTTSDVGEEADNSRSDSERDGGSDGDGGACIPAQCFHINNTSSSSDSDGSSGRSSGSGFTYDHNHGYTEQLVQFDSLGYFLEDPHEMYGGESSEVGRQLRRFSDYRVPMDDSIGIHTTRTPLAYQSSAIETGGITCSELDSKLQQWGLAKHLSARQIGCFEVNERDGTVITTHPAQIRLYNAMHITKKMHPIFDLALIDILRNDPGGRIIVLQSFEDVFPRLINTLTTTLQNEDVTAGEGGTSPLLVPPLTVEDLTRRIVLVPRMEHPEFLKLLSLSAVYLNPFPIGSGVTSSEALAMCVPVLVLPSETSILHFAAAQVRALGRDLADILIINDDGDGGVEEYVRRAVSIARGELIPFDQLKNEICKQARERLFGESVLTAVTDEWRQFLSKITW